MKEGMLIPDTPGCETERPDRAVELSDGELDRVVGGLARTWLERADPEAEPEAPR